MDTNDLNADPSQAPWVQWSKDACQTWLHMDLGPFWLMRDELDPLLPEIPDSWHQAPVAPTTRAPNPAPAASNASQASTPVVPVAPPSRATTPQHRTPTLSPETLQAISKADWATLQQLATQCKACDASDERQQIVFADRSDHAPVVVLYERPSSEDEVYGQPLTGKAGILLDAMLQSIHLKREHDVRILPLLKCRPLSGQRQLPQEWQCCAHYLKRQLELIQPHLIISLGLAPLWALTNAHPELDMQAARLRTHTVTIKDFSVPLVVTYPPAYLLRTPALKARAWQDLLWIEKTYQSLNRVDAP